MCLFHLAASGPCREQGMGYKKRAQPFDHALFIQRELNYFLNFLRANPIPAMPIPKRRKVEGSGTGELSRTTRVS